MRRPAEHHTILTKESPEPLESEVKIGEVDPKLRPFIEALAEMLADSLMKDRKNG